VYALKYLQSFEVAEFNTDSYQGYAAKVLLMAIGVPEIINFQDVGAIPLDKDKFIDKPLLELIFKVFINGTLKDYRKFIAQHPNFIKDHRNRT
jgi:hypothetical protein